MPKMKTKKCAVKRMKLSKNNLCGRTAVDSLKVTKTYALALQGR